MFVSFGIRFEAYAEALNMIESVGNYTRHRRVPYLIWDEERGEYLMVYVPAISGESIAHAYQERLVIRAKDKGLPVCSRCAQMEFFKSMNANEVKIKGWEVLKDPVEFEKQVIQKCAIEDIGGFLYAEKPPVKRTSAFQVSYALPIKSAVVGAMVDPQLQVRQSKMNPQEEGQMIYYVEIGTAIYGLTFNIDLDAIGVSGYTGEKVIGDEELKERRKISIEALLDMISSRQFGAKLSRFFPQGSVKTVLATCSERPFVVSSPLDDDFVKTTLERIEALGEGIKVYLYSSEKETVLRYLDKEVERASSPEGVIKRVLEELLRG